MFWSVSGFTQSSPIEGILDKGDYTLEELLDEDDLIQECKSLNARLIHYLKQPDTVQALLRYITVAPPAISEGTDTDRETLGDQDDSKRSFKYPYAACEVFCCEVDAIFSTLVEDEQLMGQLFSLLESPRPLNCMLAGYFARVLHSLLLRKTAETMAYLQNRHEELLPKLLSHIDTTSIAEALVRLLGADEQTRVFLHASSLQWLLDTPVLRMLLDKLGPGQPASVQKAAADVLGAVAETQLSPLAKGLAQPEVMDELLDRALSVDKGSALVPALDVCIALLEPRSSARDIVSSAGPGEAFLTPQLEVKMKTEAVFALAGKVNQLVAFLDEVPSADGGAAPGPAHDTPFGSLSPPMGSARLKVVELLAALARSGMKPAETALLECGAVRRCLQLFAQHPFNSLLHRHVAGMLTSLFDSGSDETVAALLAAPVEVPSWLAGLPQTHGPVDGGDAPTRCSRVWRAGYMGHVTQLGRVIDAAVSIRPAVADLLTAQPEWDKFSNQQLRPQLAKESPDAWACGKPTSLDVGTLDSEPDEFEGDLELEPMPGQLQPPLAQGSRRDLCGVPDYRYASVAAGSSGGAADSEQQQGGGSGYSPPSSGDGASSSSSSEDDDDMDSYGSFAGAPPAPAAEAGNAVASVAADTGGDGGASLAQEAVSGDAAGAENNAPATAPSSAGDAAADNSAADETSAFSKAFRANVEVSADGS